MLSDCVVELIAGNRFIIKVVLCEQTKGTDHIGKNYPSFSHRLNEMTLLKNQDDPSIPQ